jgi:hypothetical protein
MGGTLFRALGGWHRLGPGNEWVAPFERRLSETVRWVGGTFHSYVQKMDGDRWTVPPNQIAVPKVGAPYPILLVRGWHLVCCMGGTYCGWHRLYLMGGTFCVLFGDWS